MNGSKGLFCSNGAKTSCEFARNAVSTAPKRRFKLNLASSSATWRVQVELGGLFSLEIAQKGLPRSIWSLPNLEKTMKNAVLSSNFEVRAVLHSKRSWMRLGGFLGSNLDVLGVHLAALGTNLGPTWTLLGPTWSLLGANLDATGANLGLQKSQKV